MTLPRLPAFVLAAAVAIAGLPASAHATLFGDDEARTAIIDLRGRLELQNRDTATRIRDLGAQIEAINQRIERFEQVARGQLALQNQIELLRTEISRLRGQLEVQANELTLSQRRQRELYNELDARLKPMEPVSVVIDGATVTVEADERKVYESALTAFRASDFGTAAAGFAALRMRWPGSAYAANALYWGGSAQFALKDFKAALALHQQFLANHGTHPRAADALLSVAYSQIESGDRRSARRSLEILVDKYPDSPVAQQARTRLSTLK